MSRSQRKKRGFLSLALGVGLVLVFGTATAAEYPSKTIHLVVPFKAGGGTDTIGRGVAEALEKVAGVTVVVDNITGAGGVVGSLRVVRAKPDGYTILLSGTTDMTAAMAFKKLPFTLDDFTYIAGLYSSPTWILAHKKRGYKTMGELIAKAKANPGKITLGTAGPAGAQMLMASAIIGITGAKFRIIPYSGGKDLKKALYGDQVDAGILHAPVMLSAVKAGLMRVIGTGQPLGKITYAPVRGVKTLTDIRIPIEIGITRGMFVPKKTPKNIVAKLSKLAEKAGKSDVFKKFGKRFGFAPDWSSGASFEKQIRAELKLYKEIKAKYVGKKK